MKLIKNIKRNALPTLIALTALSVSASAAFYSVTGLSKLFAGASFEVMIMAGSLEVAKLVIASLLYQYWGQLNKILRTYLTVAATVLVLITSAGIYGFLSAAYQDTATKSGIVDKEVELLELKKNRYSENRDFLISEKKQLDESISALRGGLSNNVVQYRDAKTGQMVTTTSSANRRALQSQLDAAIKQREEVSKKIEFNTDSINSLEIKALDVSSNAEIASELGPLKYISELTGTPMNKIVNVLLLVIIFVFDPLAISLVIAANFAFDKIKPKEEEDNDDDDDGLKPVVLNEDILGKLEEVLFSKKVKEPVSDIIEPDSEQEVMVDEEDVDVDNLIDEDFYLWEKKSAEELHLKDIEKDFEPDIIFSNEGTDVYTQKEFDDLKDWDVTLMDGLEDENWDDVKSLDEVLETMVDDIQEDEVLTDETTIFEEMDEDLGGDVIYDDEPLEVEPPKQIVNKSPYLRVGNRIIPRNVRNIRGE